MKKNNRLLKKLSKLNFSTVFFFILSLVSSTFAWFAYNKVVDSNIDIELTTWDIGMTEGGDDINQVITVTIDNFSPGVETYTRHIDIKNNGDMPAVIDFEILSLRILDDEYSGENKDVLIDSLAHDYPYFFDIYLSSNYLENGDMATFDLAIGWPLDSGNNELDTEWGSAAYEFYHNEQVKLAQNPTYEVRPCIELTIKLNSTQYVAGETTEISDNYYRAGILIPYKNNYTSVITLDSKQSENTIDIAYISGGTYTYDAAMARLDSTRDGLTAERILKSSSILTNNTFITKEGISDRNIGYINNDERATEIKNYLIDTGATVVAPMGLSVSNCFWTKTSVDSDRAFATRIINDSTQVELYIENKNTSCGVTYVETIPKICTPGNCIRFKINDSTYIAKKDSTWGSWIDDTKYTASYYNGIVCVAPNNSMAGMENGTCTNTTSKLKTRSGVVQNVMDVIEPDGEYTIIH